MVRLRVGVYVAVALLVGGMAGFALNELQDMEMRGKVVQLQEGQGRLVSELSRLREEIGALRKEPTAPQNQSSEKGTEKGLVDGGIIASTYKKVKDSVVSISVSRRGVTQSTRGEGSGFVYDSSGVVVTNFHVVRGAQGISVTLSDGSILPASLVGFDVYSDLAVIRITGLRFPLKPMVLGDSSKLQVGEQVITIGNPFGLKSSLSLGVISQMRRTFLSAGGYPIANLIQVDAALNPGNSGGPLLDLEGNLVGVTTAIASDTGSFSGVGFAVPSNTVRKVAPLLTQGLEYKHPWLGVRGTGLNPELAKLMNLNSAKGWLIAEVVSGGPAQSAGLRGGDRQVQSQGAAFLVGGDVIVAVEGFEVRDEEDLFGYLESLGEPGKVVNISILRDGSVKQFQVKLGERPSPS